MSRQESQCNLQHPIAEQGVRPWNSSLPPGPPCLFLCGVGVILELPALSFIPVSAAEPQGVDVIKGWVGQEGYEVLPRIVRIGDPLNLNVNIEIHRW